MLLFGGGIIVLVVSNVGGLNGNMVVNGLNQPIDISSGYKDVFLPGLSGKPALGTTALTCWARGGICVDIKECPSLNMDISVAGCAWGYKVCCKVHELLSPTVNARRRYAIPVISNIDELGTSLDIIALRNSMLLSSWQNDKKPETDRVQLDNLFNK